MDRRALFKSISVIAVGTAAVSAVGSVPVPRSGNEFLDRIDEASGYDKVIAIRMLQSSAMMTPDPARFLIELKNQTPEWFKTARELIVKDPIVKQVWNQTQMLSFGDRSLTEKQRATVESILKRCYPNLTIRRR